MVNYTLPAGKVSRVYTLTNKESGEKVVDGSLKDMKKLFGIVKDNLIVQSFVKRVGKWAVANNHTLLIDGKTVAEVYPKS